MAPRVLLVLPTTTYRTAAFLQAARRAGLEIVVASNEPSSLSAFMEDRLLTVDLGSPNDSAERAAAFAAAHPLDAVVGVDETAVLTAAAIAARLGLRHHPVEAVRRTRDKRLLRAALAAADVPQPRFVEVGGEDAESVARTSLAAIEPPVVVKPVDLAASRGVIRADTEEQLAAAVARVRRLLRDAGLCGPGPAPLLVEEFVGGDEVAVEGLVRGGRLDVLAVFAKPDPLDGPYFEETLYVAPAPLSETSLAALREVLSAAVAAIGLTDGPAHAEVRLAPDGPRVLEVAARSIGGHCSRALRLRTAQGEVSLEELILRHAAGQELGAVTAVPGATGVMMLPIPRSGRLLGVGGLADARSVPGVDDVVISIPPGSPVVALPEGDRYLGFVFAHAPTSGDVEAALREANRRLRVDIAPDEAATPGPPGAAGPPVTGSAGSVG